MHLNSPSGAQISEDLYYILSYKIFLVVAMVWGQPRPSNEGGLPIFQVYRQQQTSLL
jgi:hypothetical protein